MCTVHADQDPTPVRVFKITPASGTDAAATATPAPTPSTSATSAIGAGASLQLTARDTAFDKTELRAAAGAITISFSNKDSGVLHHLHVYDGTDGTARSAGQTKLASGPIDQELTLHLAPGVYHYQCDAHPATKKGTLTVQ